MDSSKTKLIISLTSYPLRINLISKTVDSLLKQTLKADMLILWLAEEQFPNKLKDLPTEVLDLTQKGLTIKWCNDIKSYKKLIPALKSYPDDIIVCADDDILYEKDWLKKLYEGYIKHPDMISAHSVHRIMLDDKQSVLPYNQWSLRIQNAEPSFNNFATGVGGVLYPPNCFYKDILREDLFMKLCPTADDIWFWAMSVLNGRKINIIKNGYAFPENVQSSQEEALSTINVKEKRNDEQLNKLLNHYPDLIEKLDKSQFKNPNIPTFLERIFSIKKRGKHIVLRFLGLKLSVRIK